MKQSKISIYITPTTHWIYDQYKMFIEEQDKFDARIEEPKNLRLMVDFESAKLEAPINQMSIPVIKYKTKKVLSKKEVDLKKKSKNNNSLF